MIDVSLLKKTIREKGETIKSVSNALGMHISTFYRHLASGGSKFTIEDVNLLCAFLSLSKKEMKSIFFNNKVA